MSGAGLWESGMGIEHKRALCEVLSDSCVSAHNEQQMRQNKELKVICDSQEIEEVSC